MGSVICSCETVTWQRFHIQLAVANIVLYTNCDESLDNIYIPLTATIATILKALFLLKTHLLLPCDVCILWTLGLHDYEVKFRGFFLLVAVS